MKNKKYLPALIVLYMNYFVHGIGCSILGQAAIKNSLASAWGVEVMKITAISAALGLGRLIALPFAGPLSDKLGRKISTMIGGSSYAVYLIGLVFAFKAGMNGGYTIAYVCAVIGGIANSFLDTGIYPAVAEILEDKPSVATMGVKFAISLSQMILPFVLGMCAAPYMVNGVQAVTADGVLLNEYNKLFLLGGIAYIVLVVLIAIFKLPEGTPGEKKQGLIEGIKSAHFSVESIAMICLGFTITATFQLWLNCAQNYAQSVANFADPSIMQFYYSMSCVAVLVITAFLTKWVKDVRFLLVYPICCVASMVLVLIAPSPATCIIGSIVVGGCGSGGLLQIATSVCNGIFPKIKGTVTALVMIMSSLCNYTILSAASTMSPTSVMIMNIVITGIGIALALFVNIRYAKLATAE